jgi:hypothetical protein
MVRLMRATYLFGSLLAAGCATSSSGNYSVKYALAGAANETTALNSAAAEAFRADVTEVQQKEISSVKVFVDSVPPEITLRDNVVAIKPGVPAVMVGIVELSAVWKSPDDTEVIPALQKAARSVAADLAFCPRAEKPAAHVWRCYLVSTGPRLEVPLPPQGTTEL